MRSLMFAMTAALIIAAPASADSLHYVGSSTVGKFISDAGTAYTDSALKMNTRPESGGGEQCATRGNCDIGGVAREVGEKFLKRGAHKTLIGKDAIAAIVHADNPTRGLSSAQLKGIFTGRITNWSEVGGPDLAIKPYIVKKGSATRKVFRNSVMGSADYQGPEVVTPDAKMLTVVGSEPGAIGQLSFAFLVGRSEVRALDVDGQVADVNNSNYPITRPLYLVTKGAPAGDAKRFIDWAVSDAGQQVVKQRFVGIR